MQSQSHIHTPHTQGIGISCGWGGGGVCEAKHLEEYMKLNWNFCGGGMDFFWNYTIQDLIISFIKGDQRK